MSSMPSENILKLRELTDKLCAISDEDITEKIYEIKSVIKENEEELKVLKGDKNKVKCYESLFNKIKNILNCKN